MKETTVAMKDEAPHVVHRDMYAAILSIIPGVGHWYKGYRFTGAVIFVLGIPMVLFLAGILALATLGFSLFLPFLFWGLVMWHAYEADDHNRHHWLN